MPYVLFISENVLKDNTAINGNVDVEYLLPYLKIAQKKYIEVALGTDLYEKLQSDIQTSALAGNYLTLVDDYVQDALTQWAFYECIPFLSYKVMNNNIVSKTSENANPLSESERQFVREEVRNTAEFYTKRLVDYICHNQSLFPEYSTNTGADTSPSKEAYYSGINVENVKGKRRPNEITLSDFLDF